MYKLDSISDCEITHYYDIKNGDSIFSRANKFWGCLNNLPFNFLIPQSKIIRLFSKSRIFRRLSRLDKSNAVFNYNKDGIIIIYNYKIYLFSLKNNNLKYISNLNFRNVLHDGICVTAKGIYFGAYYSNKERKSVPIYASYDDGYSWQIIAKLNSIRHVHSICFDEYSKSLWISTGDLDGECFLIKVPNEEFNNLVFYGDGSQSWRCVKLFFTKEKIIWAMDSPLKTSSLKLLDRKNGKLSTGFSFPGPVWYGKYLNDGFFVLQSTVEIGPSITTNKVKLFISKDLIKWDEILFFKKDFWPMPYFKFGVASFSNGYQTSELFCINLEGVKKLDGKSLFLSKDKI